MRCADCARRTGQVTLLGLAVLGAGAARADTVVIHGAEDVRDNTLYEDPDGALSNGQGRHFFAGQTGQPEGESRRRGVIAFDLRPWVPPGSAIEGVTLALHASMTQVGPTPVSAHRLLTDWGEGESAAPGQEGQGAPAATGDATWLHTFYDTDHWAGPGGDHSDEPSATAIVDQNGFYDWSGPGMIEDVQAWVDDPTSSFGWILIGDEGPLPSAKRFDSAQNDNPPRRPRLTIEFSPPAGFGACCLVNGCAQRMESDCLAEGGDYQGDGIPCDDDPCPPLTGACCFTVAKCMVMTELECTAVDGTYWGDNEPCDPNPCPLALEPFVDAMPRIPVLEPVMGEPGGEATYDAPMTQFEKRFHRDLPPTTVWGYAGVSPGPVIEATTGLPVTVRWINDLRDASGNLRTEHILPVDHCPHGAESSEVRTVVHLHGAHVPPEVDGHPEHTFLPGFDATYVYPNHQPPATLWFHDHALGITRLNVYMGLSGMYLIRDAFEAALGLPSGDFEIALIMQDRAFDATGTLVYPARWQGDYFGDVMLVNGRIWPTLDVGPGKYRFRVLNASNGRTIAISLSNGAVFHQIGTDGGLLPVPVEVGEVILAPAERADLVIDFEGYADGTEIILTNSAPAPFPGHPGVGVIPNIMKFTVRPLAAFTDPLPATLREVEPLREEDAERTREFELRRHPDPCAGSMWMINGLGWKDITEFPELGATEIWSFINRSGQMHPMHVHLVLFQILDRQAFEVIDDEIVPVGERIPPEPDEAGWKDTVRTNPFEIARVIARFDDYTGRYAYHCHIVEHEDHEMMRQFEVVPACPEDLDRSGAVDFADVLSVLSAWGSCPPKGECPEDLDRSGSVDRDDLNLVLARWGPCR